LAVIWNYITMHGHMNIRLGNYFKKCGQDGVGIRPVRVYDTPATGYVKTFITDVRVDVLAPNILVA